MAKMQAMHMRGATQTAQKQQPNKLKDLFGNYDSNTEQEMMNDPQNATTQKTQGGKLIEGQGESITQMQKRPSTHKNMQTTTGKIFDIDKSVRKTEDVIITLNPNPEVADAGNNHMAAQPQNQPPPEVP